MLKRKQQQLYLTIKISFCNEVYNVITVSAFN